MEIIHPKSVPATKSEVIGITSLPSTQEDRSGNWEVILPTQSLSGASSIEFSAEAGAYATSLADSFVEVGLSASTTAGSVVAATACIVVNQFALILRSQTTGLPARRHDVDANQQKPQLQLQGHGWQYGRSRSCQRWICGVKGADNYSRGR